MRRYLTAGLISALTLAAGTAQAQIDIIQPVVGDDEFAGLNTIVTFDVDMGLNGGGIVLDGEALEVSFNLIDDMGNVVFGPFAVDTVGGAVNYVDAAGNANVQVDLGDVTFAPALANAQVTGIRLAIRTAGGTAMMFERAPFDAMDESNDEVLEAVKVGDAPQLINAFISTDGMNAFLEFSRPLNTGDAANDDNQTVLAAIDGTDLQIDTSDNFDGTEGAPAGLSNPAFLGAENTFIRFDRNDMTSDLDINTWVRPSFDNMAASQNDIFSIVGYEATSDAVQAVGQSALTIVSVEAIASVGTFDGPTDAVRVTYNLPLNPADLGDIAFYGNSLQLNAGGDSNLDITDVNLEPGSSNSVLLEITSGANDTIETNGVNGDDGLSLTLDTDSMEDVPSSIFTADDYDSDQSIDLADDIAPVQIGDVFFKDSDGDGVQDGVIIVFSEPLDSTLTGADADDLGIVLTRNGGVTLFPIGMIDPITGVMTSYDTVASMDVADDDITVTDITVMSFDEDGDGEISDLETDNALCVSFDPTQDFEVAGGGWDNDDTTTAGTGDGPGTGDDGAVNVTVDADSSDIADANGVSLDTDADVDDTDDIDEDSDGDAAAPVALNTSFRSGDNFIGFLDSFVETDGNVGDDDDNNVFYGVFSEALDLFAARGGPEDTTAVSWGPGAFERFAFGSPVRFLGANGNILQIEDDAARGFAPGDTVTFADGVGIGDNEDNQILGSFPAPDGTAPFVALQTDINGNDVLSAFNFDTNDDGFANEVRLFTSNPTDPATVRRGDFTFNGGTDFVDPPMGTDLVSGTQIVLTLPASPQIAVSDDITITYAAPANNDDMDSQIITDGDGNSVFPGLNSIFDSGPFPTPDVDTDDLAVMDLRGNITMGGSPIGVGAKVFGFVGTPVPKMISGTVDGLDFWLDDSSSLEAFWNFMFGFESHLYFFNEDGDIWFDNDFDDNSGNSYEQYDVAVNAGNLNSVTFTARGRSYTEGDSTPRTNITVTGGRVTMGWDVLRSSNGTIESLKDNGFQVDGDAIASRAVVENSDGSYAMHVSAPITQFYGNFGATGWPVVVVVEESTGNRYPASSLHNAIDNEGPILFRSLQRNTDPNDNNARSGGSNLVFDINLDNLGLEMAYNGWNLLPFNRVSGFAKTTGNIPTLPAIQGSDNSNIEVKNTLPNTRAFNQFVYFYDDDSNDAWTSNDDGDFFDSMFVDVDCVNDMRFVMTNRGVNINNGIGGFIGGYGAGFYNSSGNAIGVFQFGAMGSATEVFTGTFSSSTTLGWALVTAPAADADPTTWLNTNDADFVIEFNRISNFEVDVNTHGNESDNINDVVEINQGQAYFVSFE